MSQREDLNLDFDPFEFQSIFLSVVTNRCHKLGMNRESVGQILKKDFEDIVSYYKENLKPTDGTIFSLTCTPQEYDQSRQRLSIKHDD